MKPANMRASRWLLAAAFGLYIGAHAGMTAAAPLPADDASALAQVYAETAQRLTDGPFDRPLYLDSEAADGKLTGNIHARVDQPFDVVRRNLAAPADWCRLLLLLPNIASCREAGAASGDALRIGLVRRFDDAPASATPVRFSFAVRHDERILDVRLQAPDGPLGTRNYRIALQAIPVAGGKSFLHLRYSYEYGWAARLAAQAYLAGAGSGKRGFSVTGEDANGRPRYVDGLRGAVERNAMRCYLAIEAYLGSAQLAAGDRFAASLKQWADAIAQYPRQLRENDIDAYVAAKQAAYRDQRNAVGAGSPSMRRQDFSR